MRCIKENLEQKSVGDSKPLRALLDRLVCFYFPMSEFTVAQRAGRKASHTDQRGSDR